MWWKYWHNMSCVPEQLSSLIDNKKKQCFLLMSAISCHSSEKNSIRLFSIIRTSSVAATWSRPFYLYIIRCERKHTQKKNSKIIVPAWYANESKEHKKHKSALTIAQFNNQIRNMHWYEINGRWRRRSRWSSSSSRAAKSKHIKNAVAVKIKIKLNNKMHTLANYFPFRFALLLVLSLLVHYSAHAIRDRY